MKGMNNEDDEDSVAERKVVEKERKKGRKKDKDIAKDVEQQSAYSQSSFAADPDQFNTAGRFEYEYGQHQHEHYFLVFHFLPELLKIVC